MTTPENIEPFNISKYIPVFYLHKDELAMPINHNNDDLTLRETPVYTKYRETEQFHELVVVLLFRNNPDYYICGCLPKGGHPGDIEHITILINKSDQKINRIFYSSHGKAEGSWIPSEKIEFDGGRPVVYIAKNSHALYWKPGVYLRVWFLANDYCGRHTIWEPKSLPIDQDAPWTQYRFHGVKPLSQRVWLNKAEPFRKYNLKHRMKMIFRIK